MRFLGEILGGWRHYCEVGIRPQSFCFWDILDSRRYGVAFNETEMARSVNANVAMTNGYATSGGGALEQSKIGPWSCSPAQMRFKIINGTMNAGSDGSSG